MAHRDILRRKILSLLNTLQRSMLGPIAPLLTARPRWSAQQDAPASPALVQACTVSLGTLVGEV
jgi:hypothetical protein